MYKIIFLSLCFVSVTIFAQQKPKLVVAVVVDQMKFEYLDRFGSDFSENGFKKLIKKGFSFNNMHYNYVPTYTAPGHAAIFTGATPAINGIIGNDWFSKATLKEVYCTEDSSVSTLGNGTENEGKMSPRNLQATTITDELKLATNFKGKVIGISLKDRGAILPAGHFADWAFWYSTSGSFISSTFYGNNLPSWVSSFNDEKNYLKYLEKGWELLKPKDVYNESLTDNNPYEGKLFKKIPFFPYNLKEMYQNNNAGVLQSTPYGNNLLLDFAKKAIQHEALGKDEITDFLSISFSSTDYIGHVLGPRSIELQDTYLRLDETIAHLIDYLDKQVGKNKYLLMLTSDHGGAENVTYLKDNKYAVTNLNNKTIKNALIEFSKTTYGENFVLDYSNYNLFFDRELIKQKGLNLNTVKSDFSSFLYQQNFVKQVYTEEQILSASTKDGFLSFIVNGYDPIQNGELVVLYKPGYVEYSTTGTTHSSPYTYDTHVPLIFYGCNIRKGTSFDRKVITQIAPTLSKLLNITYPNGTQAELLMELFDK